MPKSSPKKPSLALNPSKGSAWEVRSRSTSCSASEHPFEEGESFMSRLIAVADGWERQDFCLAEWTEERRAASLFYWKTNFKLPPPKKEEPFKEENAEEAFREMVGSGDPELANTLFILAVLLERKRILIEQGVQKDPAGRTIRIYEHRDTGETFLVVDPEPSLEDIETLQTEVAIRLGWIKPEEETDTEEASEEASEAGQAESQNTEEEKIQSGD